VSAGAGTRAAFLDRDGTLIDELGYLADPDGLRLLPGAAEGVRLFNQAGWRTIVVTNQSGIARGLFGEDDLARVHARLEAELARAGARLDAILHCPHHPSEGSAPWRRACACRKPAPGLLLEGAAQLGVQLERSWAIGDSRRDVEAGRRAGVQGTILVLTGKGADERASFPRGETPTTARDLVEAARLALAAADGPQGR